MIISHKIISAAPPTTPVSHVVVTLESVEKATTMAISKTATFILIGKKYDYLFWIMYLDYIEIVP